MKITKLTAVLLVSILGNLAAFSCAAYLVHEKGGISYLKNKFSSGSKDPSARFSLYYQNRVSIFRKLKNDRRDIYFVGDSITDFGEWQELFSNPYVKNRGINGDTTTGVLYRLDEITEGKPQKVFLMCGINNIQRRMSLTQTKEEYNKILSRLKDMTPPPQIYLQSVLPVNEQIYTKVISPKYSTIHMPKIDEVNRLNSFLRNLSDQYDNVNYVDLAALRDDEGMLIADYTIDGIHLNGEGLTVWADVIKPLLSDGKSPMQRHLPFH